MVAAGVRLAVLLALAASLAGCARGPSDHLAFSEPNRSVASVEKVFVVSSRERDASGAPVGVWEANRAKTLTYLTYDVSVPNALPSGKRIPPDPEGLNLARDFAATGMKLYSGHAAFDRAVVAAGDARAPGGREALVYIPGFNTPFSQGLYRLARFEREFKVPGTKILYDWPSAGRDWLYLHDLDSGLFARDGLAEMLDNLAHTRLKGVVLMGYSSGAMILMEALRQLKLEGRTAIFLKIGGVILISPDIDVDVFEATADRLGHLPQPFFVFASRNDSVFSFFAPVWADKERLGHVQDLGRLAKYKMTFIDPGASGDNGDYNHLALVGSPTFIAAANGLAGADIVKFGEVAARGGVPGAQVSHYGKVTSVVLPARVLAAAR